MSTLELRETRRQGAVAGHHGRPIESCPHTERGPLRDAWQSGWSEATKRLSRLDMGYDAGNGYRGFLDGLHVEECPLARGQRRLLWLEGWQMAEREKQERKA